MRPAHADLVKQKGISDAHFDAVAPHVDATRVELSVPPEIAAVVMGAAGGLRDAVLIR